MGSQLTKTSSISQPWPSPPTRPRLKANDVHIRRVSLDPPDSTVEKLTEVLAIDEVTRANRFHFEADRRHFIVARACLRKLLGDYLGIGATAIHFNYSEHGKPSLEKSINAQQLSFNLAHSGSLALYAFTLKRRIGVDLEQIRPEFTVDEIARRYFSASEIDRLSQLPPALRHQAFFNCWTRKEAFIKAMGIGLSLPLDQFDVTLAPNEPATLVQTRWNDEESSRWSLTALDAGRDYVAAVAVEGHDLELRTWHLETNAFCSG